MGVDEETFVVEFTAVDGRGEDRGRAFCADFADEATQVFFEIGVGRGIALGILLFFVVVPKFDEHEIAGFELAEYVGPAAFVAKTFRAPAVDRVVDDAGWFPEKLGEELAPAAFRVWRLGGFVGHRGVAYEMERRVDRALRAHFRPEFLNRVDEIVVFRALTREQLRRIVDLQAEGLKRMLAEREIALTLTAAARDALAEEGYDPQFGARPLKRSVQRLVENPLARGLLEGRFTPGATVIVDADPLGGTLLFRTPDGDATMVADAALRRDARAAKEPEMSGRLEQLLEVPGVPKRDSGDRLN